MNICWVHIVCIDNDDDNVTEEDHDNNVPDDDDNVTDDDDDNVTVTVQKNTFFRNFFQVSFQIKG